MNDKRRVMVFGKVSLGAHTPEESCHGDQEKVGGIIAFGGARQGRVCQNWKKTWAPLGAGT